jgi:DnaA-homolog protein
MPTQLVLPIKFPDITTFSNFYPGNNRTLLNCLRNFIVEKDQTYFYLWGHQGVGCTHLLKACCHEAESRGLLAAYFPLTRCIHQPVRLFSDLELDYLDLICIDDLQVISHHVLWQQSIFHFYNRCQDLGKRLMIAAKDVPRALNLSLPDLESRLSSGILFQVHDLSDYEKIDALKTYALTQGFTLSNEVTQFLLSRLPRNLSELFRTLDRLDLAALTCQHKLTVPFVKKVLSL